MADITVCGIGFYTISGETESGRDWIDDNVQGSENGMAYSDDSRMVQDIVQGAAESGLEVKYD